MPTIGPSVLPGLFDHLAGAPTIQRLFSAPGGVIHGTFRPGRPFPPIWTPDGDCRMGFTQFGNGYVFGPEGTSLAQFQTAIDAGQIPGIHPGTAATPQDYYDAMYLAGPAAGTSLYGFYVKAESAPPALPEVPVSSPAPSGPASPPVSPAPPVDPCANLKAQALELSRQNDRLTAQLAKAKSATAKARKQMPTRGGGQYRAVLVTLLDTLDGL